MLKEGLLKEEGGSSDNGAGCNTLAIYSQPSRISGQSIFDEETGDSSSSQPEPEPASTSSHLIQGADSSQQSSEPSVLTSVLGMLMALGIFGLGIGDVLLKKGIYEDLRKHYPRKQRLLFNAYDWFDVLTIATLFFFATYLIALMLMRHKKLDETVKISLEKGLELELVKREKAEVTDGMTALNEQIAALEQNKAALEQDKAALEQDKAALEQNKVALNAKIEGLAKEVGNKNEAISSLEEEARSKNSKHETLTKENESSKEEHESLKKLFSSFPEGFETARNIVSLKGLKSQLESDLAELNRKLESEQKLYQQTVSAKKDAFEAKVFIEGDIETCELKKRGLTGEVEALKHIIEALDQEKVAKFKTNEIIKDDRALGKVEATLELHRANLQRLEEHTAITEGKLENLQQKFATQTEECDELQSKHEKLNKTVEDIEEKKGLLLKEVEQLKSEAEGQEEANEKLKDMNAKVTKERIEVHQSCQLLEEEKREFSDRMLEETRKLEELKKQQEDRQTALRIAEDRMNQMQEDIMAHIDSSPARSQVGGSMSAATSDADENSPAEVEGGYSTPVKASTQDLFKPVSFSDSGQSQSDTGKGSSQKRTRTMLEETLKLEELKKQQEDRQNALAHADNDRQEPMAAQSGYKGMVSREDCYEARNRAAEGAMAPQALRGAGPSVGVAKLTRLVSSVPDRLCDAGHQQGDQSQGRKCASVSPQHTTEKSSAQSGFYQSRKTETFTPAVRSDGNPADKWFRSKSQR